jgi:aminomethyltransferase
MTLGGVRRSGYGPAASAPGLGPAKAGAAEDVVTEVTGAETSRAAEPTRTALYEIHRAAGAKIVPFAGFAMPLQYDGILAEHARVRTGVGLFDVSHMGEVRVTGPDALAAVNRLITNDLRRVEDGRAQYTALCREDGTIVDDLICYRISAHEVFICVNASNRHKDVAHMRAHLSGDAVLVDESESYSQIAVQGPNAPKLLRRVLGEAAKLKPFRITTLTPALLGGASCKLATTGYTGEPGGEIYCRNEDAPVLWKALMEQGGDLGVGPVGLGARDTLRLEMAYCLYGNDIDDTTTPLEAGLGWVTRLDKDDFVGRAALLAQQERGVGMRLVGIEVGDRGIARHGYAIKVGGEVAGRVTSGTLSPTTGRSIAMAYVPVSHAEPGSEVVVDCRGKDKPARVVTTPFYTKPA